MIQLVLCNDRFLFERERQRENSNSKFESILISERQEQIGYRFRSSDVCVVYEYSSWPNTRSRSKRRSIARGTQIERERYHYREDARSSLRMIQDNIGRLTILLNVYSSSSIHRVSRSRLMAATCWLARIFRPGYGRQPACAAYSSFAHGPSIVSRIQQRQQRLVPKGKLAPNNNPWQKLIGFSRLFASFDRLINQTDLREVFENGIVNWNRVPSIPCNNTITDSHRIKHIVNIDFNSVRYIQHRVARLYYSNI